MQRVCKLSPVQARRPAGQDLFWASRATGAPRRPDRLVRDRASMDGIMPTTYAEPVLAWYATNARDLPWRAPGATPWAVLVSEFMLQQTPVARVLPAYLDWMARWPAPAALAAEPAGEAIRQWGR